MPGRAGVTIQSKEWDVSLAMTPRELAKGLGDIPGIPSGTGMLFDTGGEQIIQVTTAPMLFSLDIAFLSSSLVVTELARDVAPGCLVTSEHPAGYFLEVNAGELEGVEPSDRASVEFLPFEVTPLLVPSWVEPVLSVIGFVVMATFLVGMVRSFTRPMLESPR